MPLRVKSYRHAVTFLTGREGRCARSRLISKELAIFGPDESDLQYRVMQKP